MGNVRLPKVSVRNGSSFVSSVLVNPERPKAPLKPSTLEEYRRALGLHVLAPEGNPLSAMSSRITEPLAYCTRSDSCHDVDGVFLAEVVPSGKLPDSAIKMLGGDLVENAHLCSLEH